MHDVGFNYFVEHNLNKKIKPLLSQHDIHIRRITKTIEWRYPTYQITEYSSITLHNTAVTPLLMHWSYHILVLKSLNHWVYFTWSSICAKASAAAWMPLRESSSRLARDVADVPRLVIGVSEQLGSEGLGAVSSGGDVALKEEEFNWFAS